MSDNSKLLETMIKGILAERDSAQIAALKAVISEVVKKEIEDVKDKQNDELFQVNCQLNNIVAAIHDLALTQKNSVTKTPKTPGSRQGTPAGTAATAGAAAATGGDAANSKLNIMQYAKQELVKNVELLKDYEKKIDEKSPGETDRIRSLEVVSKKKDETEKTKAYAYEIYKYIKEKNEDLMKDLKSRHEKWKSEQKKDDHPAKLEEGTPAAE